MGNASGHQGGMSGSEKKKGQEDVRYLLHKTWNFLQFLTPQSIKLPAGKRDSYKRMLQMNAPFLSTKLNVYIDLDNREGARVIYIYKKGNQYRWKKNIKVFYQK